MAKSDKPELKRALAASRAQGKSERGRQPRTTAAENSDNHGKINYATPFRKYGSWRISYQDHLANGSVDPNP
jgi:hypothetical protein